MLEYSEYEARKRQISISKQEHKNVKIALLVKHDGSKRNFNSALQTYYKKLGKQKSPKNELAPIDYTFRTMTNFATAGLFSS